MNCYVARRLMVTKPRRLTGHTPTSHTEAGAMGTRYESRAGVQCFYYLCPSRDPSAKDTENIGGGTLEDNVGRERWKRTLFLLSLFHLEEAQNIGCSTGNKDNLEYRIVRIPVL